MNEFQDSYIIRPTRLIVFYLSYLKDDPEKFLSLKISINYKVNN